MGLLTKLAGRVGPYTYQKWTDEPGPDEEPDRQPGPDPEPEPEPNPQLALFDTKVSNDGHEPKTIASGETGRRDSEPLPGVVETNSNPDFPVDEPSTPSLSQQSEPVSALASKQPKQRKKKKSQDGRRTSKTTSSKKRRATK